MLVNTLSLFLNKLSEETIVSANGSDKAKKRVIPWDLFQEILCFKDHANLLGFLTF